MSASVTVKREELYEQVWTEPLIHLASKYGLTGNGLKKICRKANIPVPPPRYWQRLRVGRPDPRPPLHPAAPGTPGTLTITATPVNRVVREAASRIEDRQPETPIVVPDRLVNPHPLVQATRLTLEHGQVDEYGAVYGGRNQPHLNVRVSKGSLVRALRILDALLKALEARGAAVHLDPEGKRSSHVKIGDDTLAFRVEEEFTRKDHVPSRTDKPYLTPKWDYVATGDLTFRIDEYTDGARKTWRDRPTQRLEDLLPDILKGIFVIGEVLRARRLEWDRQERERKAALERQAELERRRREEEARRQDLEQQVVRWLKSQNLRAYLKAIAQEAVRQNVPAARDTPLGQWLTWATEHANRLDPLTTGLPVQQGPAKEHKREEEGAGR